jgi:hypothetical protein
MGGVLSAIEAPVQNIPLGRDGEIRLGAKAMLIFLS